MQPTNEAPSAIGAAGGAESLDELFSRWPLSRTDRDKIVAQLRAKRTLWVQEEAKEKRARVKPATLTVEDLE